MSEKEITMENAETKGRTLGSFEKFSVCLSGLHSAGVYWQTAVVKASQPLQDDEFVAACKTIVRKQEILQMRIEPIDNTRKTALHFRFTPMENSETIDFESVVFKNVDEWPKFISKDHEEQKINIFKGPLWRVILARVEDSDCNDCFCYRYIILLKFVHIIVDGVSAFDLLNKQLLQVLSALINGADPENIIPYLRVPMSVEDNFPGAQNSVSWWSKLGLDFFRWKNRIFKPYELPLYMFPDEKANIFQNVALNSPFLPEEAPCIPKIFEEDICRPVIETAKRQGVTVHCVLLAAGAVALSRTATLAQVQLPRFFKQQWAVDMRKFLGMKSPQPLGVMVADGTVVHETVTENTIDDFWKFCKQIQRLVRTGSNKDSCIQYLRGIKYFIDATENADLLKLLSEMGTPSCLFLSNLGDICADTDVNTFKGSRKMRVVEQFFCLTGLGVTNLSPLCQFVLTFNQRFMWNTVYNPRKVSKKFVVTYLDNLQGVLETLCIVQNAQKDNV